LLLLNIYDTLNLSVLQIENKDLPDKMLNWSLCNKYLKFKQILIEGSLNGTQVNAQLVNSIVFSKVMGFGMIRKVLKDAKLEFYSPILNRDLKEDDGGVYKTVYISKQVKVF
jgi:shikimate kinase